MELIGLVNRNIFITEVQSVMPTYAWCLSVLVPHKHEYTEIRVQLWVCRVCGFSFISIFFPTVMFGFTCTPFPVHVHAESRWLPHQLIHICCNRIIYLFQLAVAMRLFVTFIVFCA
jgi:hypothetical protein